ncbi:MBOAT family protein [Burkholderiaceae bacterium FT117]|uniref:MBOAT family O-acyltransferase n=1 Tax=Zeimonas sediminis TaxID=2944268 RepID=UPI002342F5C4|nr:MBOAT family protein [Zeimonas sediminis]MCM5571746.1 MBOAT family protein [Zeimonas sediminis]
MLFSSGEFLFLYLPIVLAGFFLVARFLGAGFAAAWLTLASLFFYGFWRLQDLPLLMGSITFNYIAGRAIQSATDDSVLTRKRLLAGAVAVNLGLLAYYKYANFLLGTVSAIANLSIQPVDVALPIGISFFTFTQIAYLVDSYAGKVRERNPLHYALFVTYFPHLIAGPVLHHAEMMPQFARRETYRPDVTNIVLGLAFLGIGLAKKVLVADSAAPIANGVFDAANAGPLGFATAWEGILAYTVQIYYDFSGYSDMAIGLSLLFGVRLPYNFNSPYKARSIVDFWRRWHMTLSRFLRDYLYVALGGNRRGVVRRYVNLAITMLLGGLWHGASWTFVAWGALHGAFLVLNHGWRHASERFLPRARFAASPAARRCGAVASTALTLLCVMIAWVFFRASSFADATNVLLAMGGLQEAAQSPAIPPPVASTWFLLLAALAATLIAPNSQELVDRRLRPHVERLAASRVGDLAFGATVGASTVAIVMLALISASRDVTEFIYFNF